MLPALCRLSPLSPSSHVVRVVRILASQRRTVRSRDEKQSVQVRLSSARFVKTHRLVWVVAEKIVSDLSDIS